MNTKNPKRVEAGFGEWLSSQLASRKLSQEEFASKVQVSQATVSRWMNGRRPAGRYIDPIADVLLLDYDLVSSKAGYKPVASLSVDPESAIARLVPLIEKVNWEAYPGRLESLENELRFMIESTRKTER